MLENGVTLETSAGNYRVMQVLGFGSYGLVYLIEKDGRLYKLKQFLHPCLMSCEQRELKKALGSKVTIHAPFFRNKESYYQIANYVPGIQVERLLTLKNRDGSQVLPTSVLARLQEEMYRMWALWPSAQNKNTILNEETGELVLIDPF